MIGYSTIGVKDLNAAKDFYCKLFDAQVQIDAGRIAFLGKDKEQPMIAICEPYNKEAPHPGNGTMLAFPGGSRDGAAALYDKAIKLGATCDGAPGQRIEDMFYGAYVRDADGNKLCFYDFS